MTIREALQNLVYLHACEQEGIESGQPTPEQWFKAVEDAEEALGKEQEQKNIREEITLIVGSVLIKHGLQHMSAFGIDAVQRAISESIIEYISQHPTEQSSNTRELSAEDKIEVFSRDECIFHYCPHPELCKDECQSKASTLINKINKDNKVIDKMTDVGKFMGKSYGNHTSPK